MKYLIAYEINEELLNNPEDDIYRRIYQELDDFLDYKRATRIHETIWAFRARSFRTTAKFIRSHILNTVLKRVHPDNKKHLRLFITQISEQNYAAKNPICDSDRGVRGILDWYISE